MIDVIDTVNSLIVALMDKFFDQQGDMKINALFPMGVNVL